MYAHRIQLLKLLQLSRFGGCLQAGERGQRYQLVFRSRDVHAGQLIGSQSVDTLNLGNNLVTAALNAEAVDVISTDER